MSFRFPQTLCRQLVVLPSSEEFKGEFTSQFLIFCPKKTGEYPDRNKPSGESIAQFGVGAGAVDTQGAEIEALLLEEMSYKREPRHDEERRFVAQVGSGIIA